MPGTRIRLDNPAFAGRLRTYSRRSIYERRAVVSPRRLISDVRPPASLPKKNGSPGPHRSLPKQVPSRQARTAVLKRQLVTRPRPRKTRHLNTKALLLTGFATLLLVFGLTVGGMQLYTNHKAMAQVHALTTKHTQNVQAANTDEPAPTGDLPAESKPPALGSYKVSPTAPKILTIKKLNVKANVVGLGLKAGNEIGVPGNIYDVGWYNGSAQPGDGGTILFDGHVHGPTQPGVFVNLKKLAAGDKLSIERGDGKVFNYHVVKTQSYEASKVDMGAAFNPAEPGKPALNMITCDGSYNDHGEYNKRLVVFTVQD